MGSIAVQDSLKLNKAIASSWIGGCAGSLRTELEMILRLRGGVEWQNGFPLLGRTLCRCYGGELSDDLDVITGEGMIHVCVG